MGLSGIRLTVAAVGVAALATLVPVAVTASAATPPARAAAGAPAFVDVCGPPAPGHVRCFAQRRTDIYGGLGVRGPAARKAAGAVATLPPGYGPADLGSAYKLPAVGGQGQTVALVDAGDDPSAEADLAVYRSTYGLPPCTTVSGCFTKVNQSGQAGPLPSDLGWGAEISLDLDMVSASCHTCRILLVESDDTTIDTLAAAENAAVRLGATEVSNSYGGTEANGMQQYEAAYRHPGTAIVASSGDAGYGTPIAPAVFPSVVAVGGTSLTRAAGARGWSETAWSGAGSGCSSLIAKPAWQHDPHCADRTVADVAADADPNTGVAVYDSHDGYGWLVVGGTSAAAPYIAGVIALAGNPAQLPDASYIYGHAAHLFDVTAGANGSCGTDLCTAAPGYDGPTGNGTPNGTGAF